MLVILLLIVGISCLFISMRVFIAFSVYVTYMRIYSILVSIWSLDDYFVNHDLFDMFSLLFLILQVCLAF